MSTGELAIIVVASLVGSLVKSVTGMGYPLIAIPIVSLFISVEDAVVVIAVPNTAANLLLNVHARAAARETRDLPVLAATAVVGAIVGTLVLVRGPDEPLLLALAATIVVYVVQFVRSPSLTIDPATSRRWSPVAGSAAGFMQGAVGVSGPVVAMWFHGYRLGKDAFVFSVTLLFLVSGAAQALLLLATGEFDRDRSVAAALAMVATLAMIPVGTRLRGRLDIATFERLVLALLVVSAVALVARSLG